jgi:hypothetical protein
VTLKDIPIGGCFEVNGTAYSFDVIDREHDLIHYSINHSPIAEVNFYSDTTDEFREYVLNPEPIVRIEKHLGRQIHEWEREAYLKAWALLHEGGNAFFKECIGVLVDYHALDRELMQLQLRGIIRPSYSSVTDLLHFDSTGGPGSGKNDLASKLAACIPSQYLILFSSVTPKALYYMAVERTGAGREATAKVNKRFFAGKIIFITEVADADTTTALKALAETDEYSEFTHSAVVKGESLEMTIWGPRCVITASVEGVNDPQLKRRFIHGSMSDETDAARLEKLELVEELLFEERNIKDDLRLPMIHAGFDILFTAGDTEFRPPEREAYKLIKALNRVFDEAGYGITNIKQFYTVCQCAAVWNRFARGYTRIEVEDVCEAWWLFSKVERETITKTTKNGISVLRTIKELSEKYDEEAENDPNIYETKRPTRADIVKASEIPQATVYRLLKPMSREGDKAGELFELGYVNSRYQNEQTVIELTKLGSRVLKPVTNNIVVSGREYVPIEPNEVEDVL